jgi:uncharacterized protein
MRKSKSDFLAEHIATLTVIYVFALYVVWIGVWLIERKIENRFDFLDSAMSKSIFWLMMKLLLWILPSVILIHLSGRTLREVMNLKHIETVILWGGGVGIALGILTLITRFIGMQPLFSVDISWALFSAVIVSPIVEEITFRGAVLGVLQKKFGFAVSNLFTALMFMGAHMPGWYFQGVLKANLLHPIGGALSIFLIGMVFGYVAHKSQSVAGSTIAHMLNNFFNA